MRIKNTLGGIVALATMALSTAALAAPGYVSSNVYLRAGPGSQYPVVASISPAATVEIYGCISGWRWCEVETGPFRGWTSGRYLETVYDDRRMYVIESAPTINIPVITFSIEPYWDKYYYDRPFYKQRSRWIPRHDYKPSPPRGYDKHDDRGRPDHDNNGRGRGHNKHGHDERR